MENLKRFLQNAEYTIDVHLDEDEWIVTFPEKKEFGGVPKQTIVYNTEDILQHIDLWCISYFIIAHIMTECVGFNYNPLLINYYDENNVCITENDALYYYEDDLCDEELHKLNILTECFAELSEGGLNNDVMNIAKINEIDKELLMLYHIVKRD